MAKKQVIAQRTGVSSTGSAHGLLIETDGTATIAFTVTGHDGKKRHASVTLSHADVMTVIDTLSAHIAAAGQ
jgi:hypothetical protein